MYNSIKEFNEKFNLQEYVSQLYNIRYHGGRYIKIPCPFHAESTASCVIYNSSYHCFGAGCGAHGSAIDFMQQITGLSISEILSRNEYSTFAIERSYQKVEHSGPPPSLAQIDIYNRDLLSNPDKISYLYNRHFDERSIKKSKIGYVENPGFIFSSFRARRYSIPVYDKNRKLITARYRIDPSEENQDEPKYLGHPHCNSALYNSHIIQDRKDIVIVGSELDAAFLYYRYNISAVALPGEGNFQIEWLELFSRQHNVLIWLDYDFAGITAALKLYDIMKTMCNTKIFAWDNSFINKQDVCDFVDRYGIFGIIEVLNDYGIKAYN